MLILHRRWLVLNLSSDVTHYQYAPSLRLDLDLFPKGQKLNTWAEDPT
jgi:hypothetical protein